MLPDPEHNVFAAGPEIVSVTTGKWLPEHQIDRQLLVFIHGFTAHGRYFKEFAQYFQDMDCYCCAIYNYDSYKGIDVAAQSLIDLLKPYEEKICKFGFAMICHSMGGLVARFAINHLPDGLKQGLCGLVTLGTPHRGAFYSKRLLSFVFDAGENLTGFIHPFQRLPISRSAAQVTGSDGGSFFSNLASFKPAHQEIPVLSISGGFRFLEIGEPGVFSRVKSRVLQRLIDDGENDGLIEESSSDYTRAVGGEPPAAIHDNSYRSWPETNHTHVIHRQEVANNIKAWLDRNSLTRSGRSMSTSHPSASV